MTIPQMEAALEAVLFTMGGSVEVSSLAAAIEQDIPTTHKIIHNMMDHYNDEGRGLKIIELEGAYQMCTKGEYYDAIVRVATQPRKPVLTDVVLETLSIVAYKQPVTRLQVESIRGVSSDHAMNKLVEYNLIQELGRLDAPGRPILFGTTEEFLRTFGLSSIEELPMISQDKFEQFSEEAEAETAGGNEEQLEVRI